MPIVTVKTIEFVGSWALGVWAEPLQILSLIDVSRFSGLTQQRTSFNE